MKDVENETSDSNLKYRRRRWLSAGTSSGGESPALAASTSTGELDEETQRRRFNAGKGNRIKNPYIPPKNRG